MERAPYNRTPMRPLVLTLALVGCGAARPASEHAEHAAATDEAPLFPAAPASTVLEPARLEPAGGGDRVVVLWLDLVDPFLLRAWASTLGPRLHAVADRVSIELRHTPAPMHSDAPRLAAITLALQDRLGSDAAFQFLTWWATEGSVGYGELQLADEGPADLCRYAVGRFAVDADETCAAIDGGRYEATLEHDRAHYEAEAAAVAGAPRDAREAVRAPVWLDGRAYAAEDGALIEALR